MIAAKQKSKDLCREIVMRKGECESCKLPFNTEQHHGIFKSNQYYKLNPHVWYDPDLQFELCDICHKYDNDAPHVDNAGFLIKMASKTPEKVGKIHELTSGPLPDIDVRTMDWTEVYKQLKVLQENLPGTD